MQLLWGGWRLQMMVFVQNKMTESMRMTDQVLITKTSIVLKK
jgi:hypothetical protein